MKNKSLYVHVPFCLKKCSYCDFFSVSGTHSLKTDYISALTAELRLKGELWPGPLDTIYIGGGTPSCLEIEQVATVLTECGRYFSWDHSAEVTLEINPGTVDQAYLTALRRLGFNRLSIGLQASQDALLLALGRAHDMEAFSVTFEAARLAGFTNISVDVMYGLPHQTTKDYMQTLVIVSSLGVEHISAYSLQLEEGTLLKAQFSEGKIQMPEEEHVVDMMTQGREYLLSQGFVHYEISNYARPGFLSRHNMVYWHNEEYLGFGPGAANYIAGRRFSNIANNEAYYEMLMRDSLPVIQCEQLEQERQWAETAILALRLPIEGIDRARFLKRHGVDPLEEYAVPISHWEGLGLLRVDTERVRLTEKGLLWVNRIQESFLP